MKAIVYHGIGDVRLEELPKPEPKEGEILLKVEACAICGTDVRIINSGHHAIEPPRVTGHEISASIAELGQGVDNYQVGDKVVVVTPVGCGNCKYCQMGQQNMCPEVSQKVHSLGYYCNGGFAEYMLIPAEAVANNNLIKYEADVSFDTTSLTEPLSCAYNAQELLNIQKGDSVVIFGAGPMGCMHGLLAKAKEASKIIIVDVIDEKLN